MTFAFTCYSTNIFWTKPMWIYGSHIYFTTAQVVFITAKIAFIFTSLSAVQIYDFHIFTFVYSPLHGFIWYQNNDQLPVAIGLLAQMVEHCTGIVEAMGSNSVQAWIFFRPYFHDCSSSVYYCEDRFHIHSFVLLKHRQKLEVEIRQICIMFSYKKVYQLSAG